MGGLARSKLLRDALAPRSDDPVVEARGRFCASLLSFKRRAAMLAGEISRSFRDLTVHDASHLDALWEMADLAVGERFSLNPAEAYVLGGAILLHDLGLSVAAYASEDDLRSEPRWSDAVVMALEQRLGRLPSKAEIEAADSDVLRSAEESLLRRLHALQAEKLALASWEDVRGEQQHLIEDSELRRAYGPTIGRLAHSHWWETAQLPREFGVALGALPGYPSEWTVEPLKLACLLRVADALHLDARRAPMFLRTLRRPQGTAADHWSFQERLLVPQVQGDRVQFTSGDPFPASERQAWWLCFETLSDVDRWLREVDALLADMGLERLQVRGVIGVDAPERLARLIPTKGWSPVDTHVQISDVAGLVEKLGGREMYGDDSTVPLRELIQNAADAVRARRKLQDHPPEWGVVEVTMGEDQTGHWLEVADNGVGMSEQVLTKGLLDFGTSYWASPDLPAEFPGLLSSGIEITGRFGIGFFSTFMLGSKVRVSTRPFRSAESETLILEFEEGLRERPLLRPADDDERLRDGGTKVRVWFSTPPGEEEGLLFREPPKPSWSLGELCTGLCPGLDVPVQVRCPGEEVTIAGDWKEMTPEELIARLRLTDPSEVADDRALTPFLENIRTIHNPDGSVVARLAVYPYGTFFGDAGYPGVISTGGLQAGSLFGLMGLTLGQPKAATRRDAVPTIDPPALSAWATEQASLVATLDLDPSDQAKCAEIVNLCGGEVGPLKVALSSDGWLTARDLAEWAKGKEQIVLGRALKEGDLPAAVAPGVLLSASSWPTLIRNSDMHEPSWPEYGYWNDLLDHVLMATSLTPVFISIIANSWSLTVEQLCGRSQLSDLERQWKAVVAVAEDGTEVETDLAHLFRRNP